MIVLVIFKAILKSPAGAQGNMKQTVLHLSYFWT